MALVAGFLGFIFLDPPYGAIALGVGALIEVGELIAWNRYLRRFRVKTGAEGLVGRLGVVTDPCEPEGSVRVRGELWRARCDGDGAAAGQEVEIQAVEGLELLVAPTGRQGR